MLYNKIKNTSLLLIFCLFLSLSIAQASNTDYTNFDNIINSYNAINESINEDKNQYGKDGIFVFISFSMPDNLIKSYIAEARSLKEKNNIDIIFVLRGFHGNSYKETIGKTSQLSDNKPVSIIVDPTLFEKYNITQVPTVVKDNNGEYDKMSGATTMKYTLEQFEEGR